MLTHNLRDKFYSATNILKNIVIDMNNDFDILMLNCKNVIAHCYYEAYSIILIDSLPSRGF